ncbi:DUF4350 domain-containing protein [Pontibacillus yanchengensis]|uniref:DUF4350 domain-containing protein n=1 Tax=Pontibacillus yanchengensis Y32 TaxID=1385514 RepID=A0A0A2TE60_9BACI|nr:DUF4350 domain-containing protein [Pontibacillus yanchengensis]KGP74142.1 hypothetical protein N782_17595 [Pontibacillus yanchengensis Y32]
MRQAAFRNQTWLWLVIVLIVFITLGILFAGSKPKEYTSFRSDSPAPTGVKGFYTYLQQEGSNVDRWYGNPSTLPTTEGNQVLIMVGPYFRFNKEETNQYRSWMESGNTIVLLKDNPVDYFNVDVENVSETNGSTTFQTIDGNSLQGTLTGNVRLQLEEEDEEILFDDKGTVALKRPIGDGHLLVSMQPDWMENGEILRKDHIEILLHLMEQAEMQAIWMDEYVHGQENMPTFITVYPKMLLVFILQAAILSLLAIWMKGKRFGPIYLPREAEVRFGDERLRALAAWYRRSSFYNESLAIQTEYVRHAMNERWGIPHHYKAQDMMEVLESRLSKEQVDLWKERANQLDYVEQHHEWSKKEYVEWSKKLDDIRKGVQEG